MGNMRGEAFGSQQHRFVAGNRRHRREHIHRLGPRNAGQQLQGKRRDPPLGQRGDRPRIGKRIAERDQDLIFPQALSNRERFLRIGPACPNVNDDFRRGELGTIECDPRALLKVLRVEESGAQAGVGLDKNFETRLFQAADIGGDERDPPLLARRFFGNADGQQRRVGRHAQESSINGGPHLSLIL